MDADGARTPPRGQSDFFSHHYSSICCSRGRSANAFQSFFDNKFERLGVAVIWIPSAIRKLSHMLASPLRSSGYLFRIIIGRPTRYHPLSALMRLSGILAGIVVLAAVMLATGKLRTSS